MRYLLCLTLLAGQALAADYDKILARLAELDKLPDTTLFSLGKNDQNQDIMGIAVGDPHASVRHVVVGTHHGNERAAAIVPLEFVAALKPEADTLYYVIPVLNISGYNVSRREETGADNQTHDSNRDYEDACETKQDFQLKSTTLIAQLIERENVISAVSVHGYVGTFTYPWGTHTTNYTTKDDAFMEAWAKKSVAFNGYQIGTHGAAIYPAAGAFEDWAYFKHGVWSYLMEIRSASSDLKKDARTLIEFFKLSPKSRSTNVGQHVSCAERLLKYNDQSRP